MSLRQGTAILALDTSDSKYVPVKVGGTISRSAGLGVTLVDSDPLVACVDTVNNRLKVDIEDVTGMGLATAGNQSTMITSLATIAGDTTSLDGKISQGVDTDLSTAQQVGLYAIKNSTSEWGSLHMTNGHNLKVSIEEMNGTADLATETTLLSIGTSVSTIAGAIDGSEMQVDVVSSALPSGAATAAKQPAIGIAGTASADVLTVQGVASMTALVVDGSASTQPISAASLPLPSGAATAAKQPSIGTAGSASADVITVQGVASMTALVVDGSASTQPISASSLPLPSGAATSALQTTGNNSLSSIDGKIVACNTGAVTVSTSALPSGAATESTLSAVSGKLPSALDSDRLKIARAFAWDSTSVFSAETLATSGGTATSSVVDLSTNGGEAIHLFIIADSSGTVDVDVDVEFSPDGVNFMTESTIAVSTPVKYQLKSDVSRYLRFVITNNDTGDTVDVSLTLAQYS